MKYYLGIDLGGTNIAVGIVDETGKILYRHQAPTYSRLPFPKLVKRIADVATTCVENSPFSMNDLEWVGMGTPSCINPKTGLLVNANNLGWRNVPLEKELKKHISLPLFIGNDASCAALGEAVCGAAADYDNVVMATIGTGLGGGVILNKKLYSGADNMGVEIGHTKLVYDGLLCTCGKKGCLECYASATALKQQTRDAMAKHPGSMMWRLVDDVSRVTARTAFDAADEKDPAAMAVIDRFLSYLAAGLSSLVTIFRPDVILLGGGVSHQGKALFDPLQKKLRQETFAAEEIGVPPVLPAALGNDAGIIGAAFLGKQ